MLIKSGIDPDIIAARGYRTVERPVDLKRLGFGDSQLLVPTLLIPALPADPARAAGRRAQVDRTAVALPHATIREYPDSDHDLHAQHPRELAADLLELAGRVA